MTLRHDTGLTSHCQQIILPLFGEAEPGSAGRQPCKEYPNRRCLAAPSLPTHPRQALFNSANTRVHASQNLHTQLPQIPVDPLETQKTLLGFHRHGNAVHRGEFVRRAVDHPFGARAVVTADIDDQRVVELARIPRGKFPHDAEGVTAESCV